MDILRFLLSGACVIFLAWMITTCYCYFLNMRWSDMSIVESAILGAVSVMLAAAFATAIANLF